MEQDDTEAELDRSAFAAVWQVLRALAAHDERVTGRITELRTNRYGAEQLRPHTAEPGLEEGEDAEELGDNVPVEDVEWLRVETTAYEDQILRTLKLRALSPAPPSGRNGTSAPRRSSSGTGTSTPATENSSTG